MKITPMEIPSRQDALCLPPGDRPAILCGEEGLFRYDRRLGLPDLFLPYDLIDAPDGGWWSLIQYDGLLSKTQLSRLNYGQQIRYSHRDDYRFCVDLVAIDLPTHLSDKPLRGVCWPDAMDTLRARLHRVIRQNALSS